eukprot:6897413-Prymnesium_polylepis.1
MLFIAAATAIAAKPIEYTASQRAKFEITSLPDAPAVSWRQFGGYIDVNDRGKIFFWLVESQGQPSTDPILLWTNGGPGCSGLTGFLTEHGPFRPTKDGALELNPNAWNRVASIVYVEQPVGVGFSTPSSGNLSYGDTLAAQDNLAFVKGFFQAFPQYADNRFFITSESYGGHYMPTLADAIVNDGGVPNFRGFMVGNPLTYLTYRNYGEYGTFYGHQLLPKPLWERYVAANCSSAPGLDPGAQCSAITAQMDGLTDGLDPYALDFPKCNDSALSTGRHERHTLVQKLGLRAAYPYFPTNYQPCTADWATAYLSRKDVQAAVHAAPGGVAWTGNWSACSDFVGERYSAEDTAAPMMPFYKRLAGKIQMLIFSGDDDSVCATLGTQQFVWDLGLNVTVPWTPWTMESGPGCPGGPACKQIAGYVTRFDGLSLVTVHGAGHLVPATRPVQGLQVLKNFLAGKW